MNNTYLAEQAVLHARHLAQTIGPRPAGSASEKQALDYVIEQLKNWGYRVERLPVPFTPLPSVHYPYLVGVIALAGCGLILRSFPWLALGLPFFIAALPQWTIWAARHRRPNSESENVFTWVNQPTGELTNSSDPFTSLILCAHVDSARALPFRSKFWLRLNSRSMDIIQRIAVMLSLLGILQWVGFTMPPGLISAGGMIAVFTALAWLFIQLWGCWRIDYSPGAIDNASGVGVLLALAEKFASQPHRHLRLGFLFTGAEETGAQGASAFARQLSAKDVQTTFMVLDMVGAGNVLRYIAADGVYLPLRTSPRLNQMLMTVCPHARPLNETLRSGDHAMFIRQGYPTAALQTSGSPQAELAYHTLHDTAELLDSKSMKMIIQCIIDFCALMSE